MTNFFGSFVERPARSWRRSLLFSLCLLPGCGSGAPPSSDAAVDADAGVETGRLVVVGPDGEMASLELTSPFAVRASADLDAPTSSVKCAGSRCLVVHPDPSNTVDLVDARTLSVTRTFTLERGADPRDAAWVGDHTVVVTQYGSAALVVIDATALTVTSIDLSALADVDGLPEPAHVASCGQRAFVQLARIDQETGAASDLGPTLAVVDLALPAGERVVDVDPDTAGVQGVTLNSQADFDMPVDCAGERLFVAEPRPLFSGGGGYEVVNLSTLVASTFDFSNSAQVGGFEVVDGVLGWRITHTDFGPGASSHLELVGAGPFSTYNTFSSYYVDQLALDTEEDLLFFPDPCTITPANQACARGIHVFHARSGEVAISTPVDVGFDAIDLAVAR